MFNLFDYTINKETNTTEKDSEVFWESRKEIKKVKYFERKIKLLKTSELQSKNKNDTGLTLVDVFLKIKVKKYKLVYKLIL